MVVTYLTENQIRSCTSDILSFCLTGKGRLLEKFLHLVVDKYRDKRHPNRIDLFFASYFNISESGLF